jgi:hypothetical protein
MYTLLFHVTWSVLNDFGHDKRWIGGKIGATSILHTCGQNLHFHPHVHFIVPAGALMQNGKWKHSRSRGKYLFKVELLSEVFRTRFIKELEKLIDQQRIAGNIPRGLYDTEWVVYAKQPFGGPEQIIRYLSRYTHRTAISNKRILKVDKRKVTFTWKDYKNNYARKETSLDGQEFLRLFAMHILPPGFTRIRHYGFLSSVSKSIALNKIRNALNAKAPPRNRNKSWKETAFERMGIKPGICKCCGGKMMIVEFIPNQYRKKQRAPPLETLLPNRKFYA